tara:strand:+ start:1382 stop:3472 length:2091 start_codon:yes stop_codon:yes gene_type:complete
LELTEEGLVAAIDKIIDRKLQSSNTNNRSGPSVKIDSITGAFTNAVTKAGGSLEDISKGLGDATKSLGIFGKMVGGISTLIGYLEGTQRTFQGLSKVGAGLDGNLLELRSSAARARLPLDTFATLVANNATELAGFSGGVSAGTRKVAALGEALFANDGAIDGFMNLGYSIEEANEFLVSNIAIQRRQARITGMSDAQQVTAALELAKQFDIVAKLTGKDAKAQQDDLIARQRDGATSSKLRLLEKQGIIGAEGAYTAAQGALQTAPAVVRDLMADLTQTGVPMTKATQNFAALNSEAYGLLRQAADATKRGDQSGAQRYAEQAALATAKSADSVRNLTIGTYGQISEVAQGQANVLQEMAPLIDAVADHTSKMEASLGRTVTFTEAFNDMVGGMVTKQGTQVDGTGDGQAPLVLLNEAQRALADAASAVNLTIVEQLGGNSVIVGAISALTESIQNLDYQEMVDLAGAIAEIVPGATPAETIEEARHVGVDPVRDAEGNFDQAATTALTNEVRRQRAENGQDTEGSTFGYIRRIYDKLFGAGPSANALGGTVKAGDYLKVGEQGPETIVAGFDGAVIPNMKAMMNRMPDEANAVIPNMKAMMNKMPDVAKILQDELQQLGAPMSEASKNFAATNLDSRNMTASNNNNRTLEQKLDILNQTMLQLVSINSTQARTGEKALKASRYNGNLMTGLGRA